MKKSHLAFLLPLLGFAAGAAGALSFSTAQAAPPKGVTAKESPAPSVGVRPLLSATASGNAAPKEASPAKEALPPDEGKPIDFEPIPPVADKPKPPTGAEWQSAPQVRFTARGARAQACKMHRLREWIQVRCEVRTTAIALLGGASDSSYFFLPEAKEGEPSPAYAEVVFPVKPGDRRVMELFSFGPAYGGSMISPGPVLQEHWIVGEPSPVIVLR